MADRSILGRRLGSLWLYVRFSPCDDKNKNTTPPHGQKGVTQAGAHSTHHTSGLALCLLEEQTIDVPTRCGCASFASASSPPCHLACTAAAERE